MKLASLCATKGAHLILLGTSLVTYLLSLTSSAHAMVFSEYSLRFENKQWILTFDQKTSYLRNAIYATKPNLKGMNLNSTLFLEATADHISSIITLKHQGEQLRILPQQMKYGGLRFRSTFLVEGLPEKPDYLTIRIDGFDVHKHSVILFRVAIEKEAYLSYFNRNQRLSTFDFTTHRYLNEEVKSSERYELILYAVLFLVLISVLVKLFQRKKVKTAA